MFETGLVVNHEPQGDMGILIAISYHFYSSDNATYVSVPKEDACPAMFDGGLNFSSDADRLYASLIPGSLLCSSDSEGDIVCVCR